MRQPDPVRCRTVFRIGKWLLAAKVGLSTFLAVALHSGRPLPADEPASQKSSPSGRPTLSASTAAESSAEPEGGLRGHAGLVRAGDSADGTTRDGGQGRYRHVLNDLVYRTDRKSERDLVRAAQELEAGNITRGLELLRRLLDLPEDGFVWLKDARDGLNENEEATPSTLNPKRRALVSLRGKASRILGSLDTESLELYEEIHGPEARRLLGVALEDGDPDRFREISRRFFHTAAGFVATDWLASRFLNHGQFRLATRAWSRLLTTPCHRKRVTPLLRVKASVAYHLSGEPELSEALLERLGNTRLPIGGEPGIIASRFISGLPSAGSPMVPEWPVCMGDSRRNRSSPASTAHLRPVWRRSYARKADALSSQLLQGWEEQRENASRPFACANFAIVVGQTVLVRDFKGIRAMDLSTGRTIWTYDCDSSLENLAAETSKRSGGGNLASSASLVVVQRSYVWNSSMGMLASDGERVYAIDGMELSLKNSRMRRSDLRKLNLTARGRVSSRGVNRLIALEIDSPDAESRGPSEAATSRHPARRLAWSAGGALPLPEWFIEGDQNRDDILTADEYQGAEEEFKRLDLNNDGALRRSEAEAADENAKQRPALAGHFFLGPPLPVDGCLYAVTESDRQLNLLALRAETGELLWSQGIGFVGLPIDVDTRRYPLSCSPSYADGVVVCPTQLGMLVGVDSLTGSLLWAYYCGDEQATASRRSPHRPKYSYGHPGFPDLPKIQNDRIVYMPRQSKFIHCVDLFTGRMIWKAKRENPLVTGYSGVGDEYVAAVTDDVVMVVGGQNCRGLSLSTGAERWSTRFGMPSGRGIRIGTSYLLPLEEGRIATIDLSTGREVGFSLMRPPRESRATHPRPENVWHPGNLLAGGDLILSAGMHEIAALPQADRLLGRLRDRLNNDAGSVKDLLLTAELELALGKLTAAKSHLTSALASTITDDQRRHAEKYLRELLYLQLRSKETDHLAILNQLDRYSKTPAQRGRYLIQRAESQMRRQDFEGIVESTSEFAQLDLTSLLPMAGNSAHLVSAASWVPSVIGRVRERFGGSELSSISRQVDIAQRQALASENTDRLEGFLAVYSRWPQAVAVRMELAQRLIQAGRFQQAELLLLENRQRGDREAAAGATELLFRLWDQLGLHQEAASLLAELEERYGDVRLPDGRTGRQYASEFPAERLTAAAYRRRKPLDWAVSHVNISEQRWIHTDLKLREAYQSNRGRFSTPYGSPFQLLYQRTSRSSKLAVVDKHSGVLAGTISVPLKNSNPTYSRRAYVGHFFPLGSPAAMNGISLLQLDEESPFWSAAPDEHPRQRDVMRVGPAGPSFCTFQSKGHLLVADLATGRILWQRTDLDPKSGLNSDRNLGLFGDAEVLVVVSPDRTTYTVYRTATGEELRRGKLDIDPRRPRYVFGRKLYYTQDSTVEKRLRCWDPLTDRIVLDEPLFEPRAGRIFLADMPAGDQLAAILEQGRVTIFEGKSSAIRLELQMDPAELSDVNVMRIFCDHDRYFLNFQRARGGSHSTKFNYYDNQSYLSTARVFGDLYAVDRQTGRVLWKRILPQRSVIQTPHFRLPFLITISRQRYREVRKRNQKSLLVEVLDAATGETIGFKDNIYPDRMLQLWYDRENGRIELTGLQTQIRLDFGRNRWQLPDEDDPL